MKRNITFILIFISAVFLLAACNGGTGETNPEENTGNETDSNTSEEEETDSDSQGDMDHAGMDHSSSGEVPEELAEAENPTYPVGDEAIINANHMGGMDGATATITGAFDTTVYTVSYTPTTGGEPVEDHKWVIHEELENPGEDPFEPRDEVVLNADHMEGMDGATATIDSAEQTTVYMVSYTDTETGQEVTHHKWVTEDELSPVN